MSLSKGGAIQVTAPDTSRFPPDGKITNLTRLVHSPWFGSYASYVYTGYVLTWEGDSLGWFAGRLDFTGTDIYKNDLTFTDATAAALNGLAVSIGYPEIYCTGSGGHGNTVYRVKEGIERFMITDINNPASSAKAQSDIPVMWDVFSDGSNPQGDGVSVFNHIPGGSNVMYMDGHVAFIKYPTEYPLSKFAAATASGSEAAGRSFPYTTASP